MDDNLSEALRMAAAILIFVGALSLAIMAFSKARASSEHIMEYSDRKTYYDYDADSTDGIRYYSQREVGLETVITSLYTYYTNQTTILFYTGKYNETTKKLEADSIKPICLYKTDALSKDEINLSNTDLNVKEANLEKSKLRISDKTREIYGFDINDEQTREEPWSMDQWSDKVFIDAFVNNNMLSYSSNNDGTATLDTDGRNCYINKNFTRSVPTTSYGGTNNANITITNQNNQQVSRGYKLFFTCFTNGQLPVFTSTEGSNAKFIERIGTYNYNAVYNEKSTDTTDNGESSTRTTKQYDETNRTDSEITFSNGESIMDENTTQKKVIQYIYIKPD